ncbi:HD domain-containing protein [Actinokineospora sp. G85]|uniref:wHTH domain-containing protein n=1 Tax=Actinokineospora sp. G85 TaxID=3406626 RepID=UPI003C71E286
MVEQSAHGDGITIQVGGNTGDVYVNQDRTIALRGWPRLVADSIVWRHVANPEPLVSAAVEAAAALERAHAPLADALADDPWFDAELPTRFVDNVGWLLGERSLELSAAEGALFTLLPLVHHVIRAEAVVEGPGPGFEQYADHYPLLRTRSAGPDGAPIRGWLLHRWLTRRDLDPSTACGDSPLLDPTRVRRLLRAVHRGPSVGGREFLDSLHTEDTLRHHGVHPVRERRLALLLALAYAVSIEPHTLPTVIAEHLAIPDPVDLTQLRTTLRTATWSGQHIPVLRATCHHAATIEALRAHVTRTDELLHALHRATRDGLGAPMPTLPTRLSADAVAPADASLAGWASFTLDTTRVRELLIGEALYKDRDLAVRELYQNALDACRYRKARTEYLDRVRTATYSYDGLIEIEQSVDPDGRHYLECRDNGIGMGETELRGVFCQAGSRFAEHPDFLAEQSDWSRLDPPIRLYPNSRFGIGVLSYFMLAEEIVVTTCRMGTDGVEGPVRQATIFGPGHLFRISKVAEQGTASGTTVRLYLKPGGRTWDGVKALEKVLRIAEFPTVARSRERVLKWDARVLRLEPRRRGAPYEVSGPPVAWVDAPTGVDLFWCRSGGALLVDGLLVGTGRSITLECVIVNLTGEWSPRRMTMDRGEVLDDLKLTLLPLLDGAAEVALDSELFTYDWLFRVHQQSDELGAMLVDAAVKRGPDSLDEPQASIARTGLLDIDRVLVPRLAPAPRSAREIPTDISDEVLLWRLAAHDHTEGIRRFPAVFAAFAAATQVGPTRGIDWWLVAGARLGSGSSDRVMFGEVVARLREFGFDCLDIPAVRADPATEQTMRLLRGHRGRLLTTGAEVNATDVISTARGSQRSPEEVAALWRTAGVDVPEGHVERARFWLDLHRDLHGADFLESGEREWYEAGRAPLPGEIVRMCLDWRMDPPSVVERLRSSGLEIDLSRVPAEPGEGHLVMLSRDGDGHPPWLDPSNTVLPQSILASAVQLGLGPHEIAACLRNLGFNVAHLPVDASTADQTLLGHSDYHAVVPPNYEMVFSGPLPEVAEVIAKLRSYGFTIPLHAPDTESTLDNDIFATEHEVVDWSDWEAGEEIPVVVAVRAAFLLDVPLDRVLDRMRAWGVPLSAWELPSGMTFETATKVARVGARPDDTDWGITNWPLDLVDLYVRAVRLDLTVMEVAEMLRGLGYVVPDVEEMVVEALKRVPVVSQPGAAR